MGEALDTLTIRFITENSNLLIVVREEVRAGARRERLAVVLSEMVHEALDMYDRKDAKDDIVFEALSLVNWDYVAGVFIGQFGRMFNQKLESEGESNG